MTIDFSRCLFLDFEARSRVNIKKVGAWAYAAHPSTQALCCGWAIGLAAPIQMWKADQDLPEAWFLHDGHWVAHNKDTEWRILAEKFGLNPRLWLDFAEVCSAAGLPRKLEEVAPVLGLTPKLGKAPLHMLCKPRKLSKTMLKAGDTAEFWEPDTAPEAFEQLYTYCARDVDIMREGITKLPPLNWVLPPAEMQLADANTAMNLMGVEVDVHSVNLAAKVVETHSAQLEARWAELMPGVNPRSPVVVATVLGTENVRKDTVRDELKHATGDRAEALTILKTLKTAAVKKLDAMLSRAITVSGKPKIHGAMVFHGAGRTGRWSSYGVQLQNMLRGLGASSPDWPAIDEGEGATDRAFGHLNAGLLDLMYDNPTRTVAAMMRGFLWDPVQGLLSGDYSQIEARILVTWAGQADAVEDYRAGVDRYKKLASGIYNVPIELVTKNQRFMGKQGILGAGYGVGKYGFQRMLKETYDIDMSLEEADRVVQAFRAQHPKVKALWYAVERLAKQVLLEQPDHLVCHPAVPRISMRMVKKWLAVRLPSGRCLWYFDPQLVPKDQQTYSEEMADEGFELKDVQPFVPDNFNSEILYQGRDNKNGGHWATVKTYGGMLVENITQAMARDVMAEAMLRLAAIGLPPCMTEHDSITSPGPAERLAEFEAAMRQTPKWWPELPLDVEVSHEMRYQK